MPIEGVAGGDNNPFYFNASHWEAIDGIRAGVAEHAGMMVMTGPAGSGKTTLMREISEGLAENAIPLFLQFASLNFKEFINFLYGQLSIGDEVANAKNKAVALREFLYIQAKRGQTTVVFVDEAQNLEPDVLKMLPKLACVDRLENGAIVGLQFVLIGNDDLLVFLDDDDMGIVRNSIKRDFRLRFFTQGELTEFLKKRLEPIARSTDVPITEDGVEAMGRYTGGSPRLVGMVCSHAMLFAAQNPGKSIDARMVEEAAEALMLSPIDDPFAHEEAVEAASGPYSDFDMETARTSATPTSGVDVGTDETDPVIAQSGQFEDQLNENYTDVRPAMSESNETGRVHPAIAKMRDAEAVNIESQVGSYAEDTFVDHNNNADHLEDNFDQFRTDAQDDEDHSFDDFDDGIDYNDGIDLNDANMASNELDDYMDAASGMMDEDADLDSGFYDDDDLYDQEDKDFDALSDMKSGAGALLGGAGGVLGGLMGKISSGGKAIGKKNSDRVVVRHRVRNTSTSTNSRASKPRAKMIVPGERERKLKMLAGAGGVVALLAGLWFAAGPISNAISGIGSTVSGAVASVTGGNESQPQFVANQQNQNGFGAVQYGQDQFENTNGVANTSLPNLDQGFGYQANAQQQQQFQQQGQNQQLDIMSAQNRAASGAMPQETIVSTTRSGGWGARVVVQGNAEQTPGQKLVAAIDAPSRGIANTVLGGVESAINRGSSNNNNSAFGNVLNAAGDKVREMRVNVTSSGLSPQETKEKAERLVATAKQQFAEKAYIGPRGANAYESYRAALALVPEHPEAASGIRQLREIFAKKAEAARASKEWDSANEFFETAIAISKLQAVSW